MRTDQVLGGRYQLTGYLGSGGMATVWRAQDNVLNRIVAVKILDGRYSSDPLSREMLRAEAQAAASLSHPHITSVHDYGEAVGEDGVPVPYIVMEFLPGQTLFERLDAGPIPHRDALRVCAEVAAALAAAHGRGLVHRDVKPSNVMLTPSGAKVLDFGIAAAVGGADPDTDGHLLGTPAYLAPERLIGGAVLPASDVYALGLLIHRLLTNRLPWTAETTTQMLTSHLYAEPAPLPAIDGVPSEINELARRCLAKHPEDRPGAAEVAAVLAAAASTTSPELHHTLHVGSPEPPSLRPGSADESAAGMAGSAPSRRATGTRRRILTVVALVVVSVAAAAAFLPPGDQPAATDGERTPAQSHGAEPLRTPRTPASPSGAAVTVTQPAKAGAAPATTAKAPPTTPTTPAPRATASRTSAAPIKTPGTTITARGGAIRVQCSGTKAQVLDVQPAAGYTIKDLDPGPADEVQVVLESATNESEIKVKCLRGGPQPKIKESSR